MRRLLLGLSFLHRRGCTCDVRFLEIAHDVDCPIHGFRAAVLNELWRDDEVGAGGSSPGGTVATDSSWWTDGAPAGADTYGDAA